MSDLTTSQVDRAGKVLRRALRGDEVDWSKIESALETLSAFRALHQRPLTTANMGLRSMVKTERCVKPEVSQRLKRVPTIIDKLRRHPTMALSRLQDLGGCRAVLSSVGEIARVQERLTAAGRVVDTYDYIAHPKPDGYRGVHVVVLYHGRQIEVQLRTQSCISGLLRWSSCQTSSV